MSRRELWFDDEAGPLVRPFAITGGRTDSGRHELDIITLVIARHPDTLVRRTGPEYTQIVRLCQYPQSVAEVAAHIHLPLALAKILISDLVDDGALRLRSPLQADTCGPDDINLLRTVLDGIRNL
jgi:hypothetical protein